MMSLALAMALNMAAAKADPMDNARKAFSNCITELTIEHLDKQSSAGDFTAAAQEGCAEKKKAYFDMIVKAERGFGSNQKDAEEYAKEEVQAIVDKVTGDYGTYQQDKTRPVPEK